MPVLDRRASKGLTKCGLDPLEKGDKSVVDRPESKHVNLIIYFDYELERGAERAISGPKDWGIEDYRQTKRLLEILDEYEIKATFAVLGFAALEGTLPYHAPDQIREIAERGHEVASHGWEHEWIPDLQYDELKRILKRSKKQLEQVTGHPIISFVPPWDVPTRYLRRGAVGLGQWIRSRHNRIDIPTLCLALREVGYKTCRVSYEALPYTLSRHLLRKPVIKPTKKQRIKGILCFRRTCGGFANDSIDIIQKSADPNQFVVVAAHPHSLIAANNQNLRYLGPFLDLVNGLRFEGKLVVTTPGEVYRNSKNPTD